jgi:hypothetical protein
MSQKEGSSLEKDLDYLVHRLPKPGEKFYPREKQKNDDPFCEISDSDWNRFERQLYQINEATDADAKFLFSKVPHVTILKPNYDFYSKKDYDEIGTGAVLIKKRNLATGLTLAPDGKLWITTGICKDEGGKLCAVISRPLEIEMKNGTLPNLKDAILREKSPEKKLTLKQKFINLFAPFKH